MILSLPTKILSLFLAKPKHETQRPIFYQKSLKTVNNNVTYFAGCVIEILPDGTFKAFDKVVDSHFEACRVVIEWKAKHENQKQQMC